YYSLPSWSYAGCSDSKIFDQQAVAEATMMTMLSAFAGANLNHDVGYLEAGLTSSLEAVVAGEEIIGAVRRIAGGVEITAETLALDLIDQVGPGGEFLTTDHTLRHFREDWFPRLFDRTNYETWVRKGKRTLGERATEKAREILHAHLPVPLDEGIRSQISRIIARAESRAKASEL
ncbi:MAG: trimethylamine methyltransferase family protein, partial [Spirochaetes bacterium]|nr:trimethylamine methyltransferase family protein [Spirochaetota bacterium]